MALKLSLHLFIGCYRSYFLLFNLLFFILSLHFLFFLKDFVELAIFLAHHFMRLHFLFIIFCFLIQNLCCYCYHSLTIHSYLINLLLVMKNFNFELRYCLNHFSYFLKFYSKRISSKALTDQHKHRDSYSPENKAY
jgi:hypothetical protein